MICLHVLYTWHGTERKPTFGNFSLYQTRTECQGLELGIELGLNLVQ